MSAGVSEAVRDAPVRSAALKELAELVQALRDYEAGRRTPPARPVRG